MIRGDLKRALAYLSRWDGYWRATNPAEPVTREMGAVGPYPLDFRPRISEGHYPVFDVLGVPMWPNRDGSGIGYHITTMTSYALARWHRWVTGGGDDEIAPVVEVANRLLVGGQRRIDELHLLDPGAGALLSAMSQGEGISVLCRAWRATGDRRYLDGAARCFGPFRRAVEADGVVGRFGDASEPWYEELTSRPLHHILNGMIYALWGLRDLAACTGDDEPRALYQRGVGSVTSHIHQFDVGWWSWYWVPEPGGVPYHASMMYQNLHVCQLEVLARDTGEEPIRRAADRFRRQARAPLNRLRAGLALAAGKRRLARYRSRCGA